MAGTRAERESAKGTAPKAAAIQVLLDASVAAEAVSVAEVWEAIERVVLRGQVAAALAAVCELAPPPDEEADEDRIRLGH